MNNSTCEMNENESEICQLIISAYFWQFAVFKIRSATCRTEAQFCENLYMIKKESLPNLAGPTQILPVNVRGLALILKTEFDMIIIPL